MSVLHVEPDHPAQHQAHNITTARRTGLASALERLVDTAEAESVVVKDHTVNKLSIRRVAASQTDCRITQ
jgi:hypothetical protein